MSETSGSSLPEGKLAHVLEGTDDLEAVLAAKAGLVTRLKATVDVRERECNRILIPYRVPGYTGKQLPVLSIACHLYT